MKIWKQKLKFHICFSFSIFLWTFKSNQLSNKWSKCLTPSFVAIQHTACGCRTIMITTNCDLDAILVLKSLISYIASPLFVNQNGDPLTKIWIYFGIKHVQTCIGCNVDVYGHSFRIGTAINATSVHMEDHIIKVLGSWSSDVYCRYIRTPACTTFLSIT